MSKKGFTLVELLAVIAILAILVIIALPNILKMFNNAKKDIFLTEAKNIYKEVTKKYINETMRGNKISTISNTNNKLDLESNDLTYDIKLSNEGKIKSFQVDDGTYCIAGKFKNLDEITIDKIKEGKCDELSSKPIYCTLPEGTTLEQGTEYINGDYTYKYMLEAMEEPWEGTFVWRAIDIDGWGVALTNRESTSPVTSKLCTYINNKPVVSYSFMFAGSKAKSIDLSSFNTSNVKHMYGMFEMVSIDNLDLSNFDTSNISDGNMVQMFAGIETKALDLSSFDTSNVTRMDAMFVSSKIQTLILDGWNTNKVTNMSRMFTSSKMTNLDLSNFDTSNVTDMDYMFSEMPNIVTLDISSFDTSKVTEMHGIFRDSPKLKTIYASNKFITDSLHFDHGSLFSNNTALVGGAGTVYNKNKNGISYARIDGGETNPGYFTAK